MISPSWRTWFRRPLKTTKHLSSDRARRHRRKPVVEVLENRLAPAVIMVTTAADDNTPNDGSVSLREAIQAINNGTAGADLDISSQSPGTFGVNDTINFAIPQPAAGAVVQTINVGGTGNGALPALTNPMTINGYSEMGASMNTLANGDNAKILIELNGANAGPNADGILLGSTSTGSTIEGLAINRFSLNGIEAQSGGNVIAGNFVGTNPAGTAAEPNQNDGIHISNSSTNTIGGTTPGARNVASGNQIDGIHIVGATALPATGNLVEGNFVGVNAAGTGSVGIKAIGGAAGTPAGNFVFGIEISGGNANTIGGATTAARNVVGLNADGIEVDNGGENNVIEGNFSGVGADGVTPVGNNLHGIVLRSDDNLSPPFGPGQANEPAISGNIIGLNPSTFAGLGNLVEFNGTGGIAVFGNPPQNNVLQTQNSGNSILGNSIFENGRSNPTSLVGIDLSNQFVYPKDDGVTPNDAGKNLLGHAAPHGDPSNPNNFQNAPVLTSATSASGTTTITGSLTQSVSPATTYRIEFFANSSDPLGGLFEGQTFLGATNVTTNASGVASFSVALSTSVTTGQFITATATNTTPDPSVPLGSVNVFNTSEFSAGLIVGTPNQVFLIKVYKDLLNRPIDAAGLANWSALLAQGVPRDQVVLQIESSQEYRIDQVQGLYQRFLHRAAEPFGLVNDVNFLMAGGTVEQLEIAILSSTEYFQNRGSGTNDGFVTALYMDLLNRGIAGDPGAQGFINALNNQTILRSQVAGVVAVSQEDDLNDVKGFYTQFLRRPLDSSGQSTWVGLLLSGVRDETVIAEIMASPEYFNRAV